MSRQLAPVALLVTAGMADATGRSDLAFYALLAAVPVVTAAALAAYGDVVAVDGAAPASISLQTMLWGLALVFVTASAAVRAPAFDSVAPAVGGTTLTACLAIAGLQGTIAAVRELKHRS